MSTEMAARTCSFIFSIKRLSFSTPGRGLSRRPRSPSVGGAIPPRKERRNMSQEQVRTLHIYLFSEDEDEAPVIEAEPEPDAPPLPPLDPRGLAYCACIGAFFALLPLFALLFANLLPPFDASFSQTRTLTLAVHPSA